MIIRRFLSLGLLLLLPYFLPAQVPELVVPAGHTRDLLHLEVSPSGGWLASSSIDETVKIWDAASGRELHTFRPGNMSRDLAFSPDERYLAVAAFNRIHLLERESWREVAGWDGWNTTGVCFHPRKQELYYLTQRKNSTGEDPLQVYAVTVPGGVPRLLATIERSSDRKVAQLDLDPQGSNLLLVQGDAVSHLIPTSGGRPVMAANARRFTPAGDLFFVETAAFGVRTTAGEERWRLATTSKELERRDLVHTMAFDAATAKFYWANTEERLAHGSYLTGQPSMYTMPPETDRVVAAGPEGKLYLADNQTHLIKAYSLPDLRLPQLIGETVLPPVQLAGSAAGNQLSWGRGEIKTLRFVNRQVLPYGGPDGRHASGRLSYNSTGNLLAAPSATSGGDIFSYRDAAAHPEVKRFKSGFKDAKAVAAAASGKWLAVVAADGYLLMNTATHKSTARGTLAGEDKYFGEDAALNPDGTLLLLSVAKKIPGSQNTMTHTRLVQCSTGKPVWEVQGRWEHPVFSPDGKRITAEIFENFATFSTTDGREISRHPLPPGRFPYQTRFNEEQNRAVYTHDNRAYVYDFGTNQEHLLRVPGEDIPFDLGVFFGDDFAAFAGREGVLRIFDLRSRKYVASLVRYADSDDWALVAPDGRFDATAGAMQKMYYRIGTQRVALEQLFGSFFTPGLAAEIFNRLPPATPVAPPNINQLRPAPSVEIGYQPGGTRNLIVEDDAEPEDVHFVQARTQDAIIVVKGSAPQDGLAELRLYRNGKLLGDGERNLIVTDDEPETVGNERRYRVRLLPGNNAFRAVAINRQQTESPPAYLTVAFTDNTAAVRPAKPVARPGGPTGPPEVTVHLVTVGIDNYANPSYNLNYAAADAAAIDQQFAARMASLAGNIRQYNIRNQGATQAGILAQLQTVVAAAGPNDLFLFYFAGHGIVPDREKGDFYLVPYEVTDPFDPQQGVVQRGIAAATLRKLSTAVAAERQLFVLDACQSGGALSEMTAASRGAVEEKAIASLARTTGTHWLTATDSEQLAAEFDALGHGAFTYALLEGLAGKADESKDGAVSANELKDYLEQALPAITERYLGRPQYPRSFGYGRDFTIAR